MISVVIPSRLAPMPDGRLWLERALDCVRQQRLPAGESVEIIVGLDQGIEPPERLIAGSPGLRFVNAARRRPRGQAAALNAALRDSHAAIGSRCWKTTISGAAAIWSWLSARLSAFDFVSASQRCVDPAGKQIGVFGPATPSGWVMPRRVLDKVGLFDEAFRFHLDSEWLGRLNRAIGRRGHFVEGSDLPIGTIPGESARAAHPARKCQTCADRLVARAGPLHPGRADGKSPGWSFQHQGE